jgi:hypothetical protein
MVGLLSASSSSGAPFFPLSLLPFLILTRPLSQGRHLGGSVRSGHRGRGQVDPFGCGDVRKDAQQALQAVRSFPSSASLPQYH